MSDLYSNTAPLKCEFEDKRLGVTVRTPVVSQQTGEELVHIQVNSVDVWERKWSRTYPLSQARDVYLSGTRQIVQHIDELIAHLHEQRERLLASLEDERSTPEIRRDALRKTTVQPVNADVTPVIASQGQQRAVSDAAAYEQGFGQQTMDLGV